jgi:hypothetical protein
MQTLALGQAVPGGLADAAGTAALSMGVPIPLPSVNVQTPHLSALNSKSLGEIWEPLLLERHAAHPVY